MANEQVNLTPKLMERAQKRLDYILREGSVRPAVSSTTDTDRKPHWYDEERFKQAQKLVVDNNGPLGNSILIGILLNEQQPFTLIPLLATGQSKNVSKLFNRYLNVILHFYSWYHDDPFDKTSKSYKSFRMVKHMHQSSGKLMNDTKSKLSVFDFVKKMLKETGKEDEDDKVIEKILKNKNRIWVSQADMAIVLWGIIGPLIMEPTACGGIGLTKEELIEICYVWRVANYKMGVDDEFNLLNDLDFDLIYTLFKLMFEQEFLPYIENASTPIGIRMSQGTSLALEQLITYYKWRSFVGYWYKVLNINAFKLNRANLDSDKYDFPTKPLKTKLTDKDQYLMMKNGYNLKYIVQNPETPFEEIEIESYTERFYQYFYQFYCNVVLRFQTIRNYIGRNSRDKVMKVMKEDKANIIDLLKKNFDESMKYPACPFLGTIETKYFEYSDLN